MMLLETVLSVLAAGEHERRITGRVHHARPALLCKLSLYVCGAR